MILCHTLQKYLDKNYVPNFTLTNAFRSVMSLKILTQVCCLFHSFQISSKNQVFGLWARFCYWLANATARVTTVLLALNQQNAKIARISSFKELMVHVTCAQMDSENRLSMGLLTSAKSVPFSTKPVIRIERSVFTITSVLNLTLIVHGITSKVLY